MGVWWDRGDHDVGDCGLLEGRIEDLAALFVSLNVAEDVTLLW